MAAIVRHHFEGVTSNVVPVIRQTLMQKNVIQKIGKQSNIELGE